MAKFSDTQRKWVDAFLGTASNGDAIPSATGPLQIDPALEAQVAEAMSNLAGKKAPRVVAMPTPVFLKDGTDAPPPVVHKTEIILKGAPAGSVKSRREKGQVSLGEGARIVDQTLGPAVTGPKANTLYMLLDEEGKGPIKTPGGVKLNEYGREVLAAWGGVAKLESEWRSRVETLQKDKGNGPKQLASVKNSAAAIGARSQGQQGDRLRGQIDAYLEAQAAAKKVVREIPIKMAAVEIALTEVNKIEATKGKVTQGRAVEKKKEEVEAEKKKIEERKKDVATMFSIVTAIVNAKEWGPLIIKGAISVSEKVMADNVSTSRLDTLKKELSAATSKFQELEDLEILLDLQAKTQTLQQKSTDLENVRNDFSSAADEVQRQEVDVVETMEKSRAMEGAAKAIAKFGDLVRAAAEARDFAGKYMKESEPLLTKIDNLRANYSGWASRFKDFNDPKSSTYAPVNEDYAKSLQETAKRNADALVDFKQYVDGLRTKQVPDDLAYLARTGDDSYVAGYDKIPEALQAALVDRNKKKK